MNDKMYIHGGILNQFSFIRSWFKLISNNFRTIFVFFFSVGHLPRQHPPDGMAVIHSVLNDIWCFDFSNSLYIDLF
jgi:hypothetical protein